jgi:hypothetical protein
MFAEAFIIIVAIFLIATASIGIECYNSKKEWENNKSRTNNKNFMIFTIIFAILSIFGAGAMMYMEGKSKGVSNYLKARAAENTAQLLNNKLK